MFIKSGWAIYAGKKKKRKYQSLRVLRAKQ